MSANALRKNEQLIGLCCEISVSAVLEPKTLAYISMYKKHFIEDLSVAVSFDNESQELHNVPN